VLSWAAPTEAAQLSPPNLMAATRLLASAEQERHPARKLVGWRAAGMPRGRAPGNLVEVGGVKLAGAACMCTTRKLSVLRQVLCACDGQGRGNATGAPAGLATPSASQASSIR
jgi:hypothetical protein